MTMPRMIGARAAAALPSAERPRAAVPRSRSGRERVDRARRQVLRQQRHRVRTAWTCTTCCGRCSSRPSRTATAGGATLVSQGAGWVERIVVDQPGVSSFFTPLSICINVDSWEHLEFDTRPDQLLAYTLVQGDERVVLEFAPAVHGPDDEPVQQSLRLDPLSQYIQMELSVATTSRPPTWRATRARRKAASSTTCHWHRGQDALGRARRAAPGRPCSIPAMFERTQLPGGPRVISARMPGTRSLSVAVTVLVGSRHERRRDSGLAHFMEHITFRGTQALPTSRAVSEAVEGVGGTSNASTDRESTVYWVRLPVRHAERAFDVLSELLRAAPAARRGRAPGARHHRGGDPLLPRRPGPVRVRPVRPVVLRRHAPGLGDRGRRGIRRRRSTGRGSATSGRPATSPPTWSWPSPATWPTSAPWSWSRDGFGTGTGALDPWLPATPAPCDRLTVSRRRTAQAHLCLGLPALPRDHPDQWTLELLDAVLGRRVIVAAVPVGPRGRGSGLRRPLVPDRLRRHGVLQVYAGVDPDDQVGGAGGDPGPAGPAARRAGAGGRAGQGARLRQWPDGAASRGDPSHVLLAGLPGGAPRPGADARRGARRARRGHAGPGPGPRASGSSATSCCRWRSSRRAPARGRWSARCGCHETDRRAPAAAHPRPNAGRGCPGTERPTSEPLRRCVSPVSTRTGPVERLPPPEPVRRARAPRPGDPRQPRVRTADARLARLHLRGGLLTLARAELEQMAGAGTLDREALVDLAEARWRSGDLEGAAEAAEAHLGAGGDEPMAHLIVAEQAEREGRILDARQRATLVQQRARRGHRAAVRRRAAQRGLARRLAVVDGHGRQCDPDDGAPGRWPRGRRP